MKQLTIPFIADVYKDSPIEAISSSLNLLYKNPVDIAPWPSFPYKPEVFFSIAHGIDCIFLKYYVSEKSIQASYRKINEPVHKDTCVEFFVAFDNEKSYYNLEFNCAGTCHASFGENRNQRNLLPEATIRKIKHQSLIKTERVGSHPVIYWELTLVIPFEVFCYHAPESITNEACRVNFYKCGDDLPVPHYLCWNNIQSPNPDFHLPEFFGEALFM